MDKTLMESAGGLAGSKLALADAEAGNVLEGKMFYAGDKEIKTGTMPDNSGKAISLNPGESVKLPEGYYDGTAYVTAGGARVVVKSSSCFLSASNSSQLTKYGSCSVNYSELGLKSTPKVYAYMSSSSQYGEGNGQPWMGCGLASANATTATATVSLGGSGPSVFSGSATVQFIIIY